MGLKPKNYGQDFNFFKKITVTRTTFGDPADGYESDIVIPFNTHGIMLLNEDDADVVEFSFKPPAIHGELDPTLPSRALSFDNIKVTSIWLRLKSGSSAIVSIYAWSAI